MSACAICGREGRWELHHLTGKDDQGTYLDPRLTIPLCHDHHTLCSDDWNTLDLAKVEIRLTMLDRVELRLLRLAQGLARIDAGQGGGTIWGRMAAAVNEWARELHRFREGLDDVYPDWRSHLGLYPPGENGVSPMEA
jgi:hypothetical protein